MNDQLTKLPGLPDGHPWKKTSRWGMAWRVALGSAIAGMLGITLLALIGLLDNNQGPVSSLPFAIAFGILPALPFGILAAVLGPWLARFYPFTQGILFGVISAVVAFLLLALTIFIGNVVDGRPAEPGFGEPISGALFIMLFAGVPLALMAGIGLAIAIKSTESRRFRLITFWALAVAALVFVVVQLVI